MQNETKISENHLNRIDVVPSDAFQIKNLQTNSCLSATDTTGSHTSQALYSVSMAICNSSLPQQFWRWTNNDSIVNIASYLCLTTDRDSLSKINGSEETKMSDLGVEMLSLVPCLGSEVRQKWSCSGRFIQQPTSGKCLTTADTVENGTSSSNGSSSNGENSREEEEEVKRRRRNSHLMEMVEELGQFLHNVDERTSDNERDSTSSSPLSSNTTSPENSRQPMACAEYCRQEDKLQMWAGLPKDGAGNSISTICSQEGDAQHNLHRCYSNDMTSVSHVQFSNNTQWLTCDRHGYYVNGFYHTHLRDQGMHLRDGLITGMQCCATSSVFTGEAGSPMVDHHEDDCDEIEWWRFQDVLISEGWFLCPKGKFLKGFEIGPSENRRGVHRILRAKCCRRHAASDVYEHCYPDRSRRVDDTGIHTCRMKGYLVTAMYLDRCTEGREPCSEALTCCMET